MATLGNLLSRRGGTPVTGRKVRLRLLRRDPDHRVFVVDAEALLFPVSAEREIEVLAAAAEAVKHSLQHEQNICVAGHFLAEALRDPERPHVAFVQSDQAAAFIGCLTVDELTRLHDEYRRYMADEYSQPKAGDDARQTEAALGFSLPDQDLRPSSPKVG